VFMEVVAAVVATGAALVVMVVEMVMVMVELLSIALPVSIPRIDWPLDQLLRRHHHQSEIKENGWILWRWVRLE